MPVINRTTILEQLLDSFTFGPNPHHMFEIVDVLDLGDSFVDCIDVNNPSKGAPYHGALHEAAMATAVFEGAAYYDLSVHETIELVVAASMHDFDHTAGEQSDDVNIKRAIAGLSTIISDPENILFKKVANLIEVTQYPYVREAVTLPEQIMRDADLMMPYLPTDTAVFLFLGLKQEMEKSKGSMTARQFADGVLDFYSKVTWHTEWAQEKAKALMFDTKLELLAKRLAWTNT